MVSSDQGSSLVHSLRLSSVGPGLVTAPDSVYEPDNFDLAMKLHYVRVVYYYGKEAFENMTTLKIKEPMFYWLSETSMTCGRFRRDEASGRPYIKCNDCGVRIIEAKCDKTLDEWLEVKDTGLEKLLVYDQCIGPELLFAPLLLIQYTKFKCGGTAVGLSWAHVLGDPFSAADFMNRLNWFMAGNKHGKSMECAKTLTRSSLPMGQPNGTVDSLAIKRVSPVGDNWIHVPETKMDSFSFNVTSATVSDLQSRLGKQGAHVTPFELISALLWHIIVKIREDSSLPQVVTVCEKGERSKESGLIGNSQVVSLVKADFTRVGAELGDLVALLKKRKGDEKVKIEECLEKENGLTDYIVYGANLTFSNFDDAKFYEFEYSGHKPVNVSCYIDGVGEQGAVFVNPLSREATSGRAVTVVLPENEIAELKSELEKEGILA